MPKIFIHECGGDLGNMTSQIELPEPVDFGLNIGSKFYRMHTDKDGNLCVNLINGVDAKFITDRGYPTICLTQENDTASDYEHLKSNYCED